MGIFGWPWKRLQDRSHIARGTITVPAGFQVRTWPAEIPRPSFTWTDGGVLLASAGPGTDMNVKVLRAVFDAVERALSTAHGPARIAARRARTAELMEPAAPEFVRLDKFVVWTFQERILEGWGEDASRLQELLRRFHALSAGRRAPNQFLQVVLVRKSYFDEASWIFRLIQDSGIEVRELSPDGVALVEVHRPEGTIVSALVGTPFGCASRCELRRFSRERDVAELRGDRQALERLDEDERCTIEAAIPAARDDRPLRPFECAPLLRLLITKAAAGDAEGRHELRRYLRERGTALLVPGRAVRGGLVESDIENVGTERVLRAFPDLQSPTQSAPSGKYQVLAHMRPLDLLDMCRAGGLALCLEAPGDQGPVTVILRAEELDPVAAS
jgi:hypothetical protein